MAQSAPLRSAPHANYPYCTDYTNTFRKFQTFLCDDPPIAAITTGQVRAFFASCDHYGQSG
jgi:hypothetical protein